MTPPVAASRLIAAQLALKFVNRWLARVVVVACSALLVFLSASLFLQVVFRYVLQVPLPWTEEAARFAFVWYATLSAAATAWAGNHFIFRWATLLLNERGRHFLRLAVNALTLAILAVLLGLCWQYLHIFKGQTASATGLDMRLPFSGLLVGLACFFVIYVLDFVDGLLALRTGVAMSVRETRERETYGRLRRGSATVPPEETNISV